jgi:hypothetical protein
MDQKWIFGNTQLAIYGILLTMHVIILIILIVAATKLRWVQSADYPVGYSIKLQRNRRIIG